MSVKFKFKRIKGNFVHPTAVINWKKITIGKNNTIGPYVVIGTNPQWKNKRPSGKIIIGNNNIIHEYCNIHLPTNLKKKTYIGNNNYLMNSITVDHDCYIENNVTLSSNVVLGGNVHIMKNSTLGIKTVIHQNQVVGSYSMIGMGSIVTKKIELKPGNIFYGKPVKKVKKNIIALNKHKINYKILKKELNRFKKIRKSQ